MLASNTVTNLAVFLLTIAALGLPKATEAKDQAAHRPIFLRSARKHTKSNPARKLRHVHRVQSDDIHVLSKFPRNECVDNSSYVSKIGSTCETIERGQLNCDGFTELGFTTAETDELKASCPIACGLCDVIEPLSILTNSPTAAPDLLKENANNMGTCYGGICSDDPSFVGRHNLNCNIIRMASLDCGNFAKLNYVSDAKESRCMFLIMPAN